MFDGSGSHGRACASRSLQEFAVACGPARVWVPNRAESELSDIEGIKGEYMEGMASKLLTELGPGEVLTLTGPGVVRVAATKTVAVSKSVVLSGSGVLGKSSAKFALPALSAHFPALSIGPAFGVGLLVIGALWLVKTWTVGEKQLPVGPKSVG